MREKRVRITMLVVFAVSLITLGSFLFLAGPSFEIQWKQTYDNAYDTFFYSVGATSDGGFVSAGWTSSRSLYWADLTLQKMDARGNQEWIKTYADTNDSLAFSVDETTDGGYIVSGITGEANSGDYRPILVKVDANGDEQWNRTYAGRGYPQGLSVQQTADGGFVMVGTEGVSVIKTYSNGSLQWERTYSSGGAYEDSRIVRQTPDGGYVILAIAEFWAHEIGSARAPWLLKVDEGGNPQWNRTFFSGENYVDNVLYSIQQTSDGGYVLAGTSNLNAIYSASTGRGWLLKLNSNGSTRWSKTFGAADRSRATEVQQTSDGGYIVSILAPWGFLGDRVWLWKTDINGSTVWSKPMDTSFSVYFLQQTSDGDYVVAGQEAIGSRLISMLIKVHGSPPLFPLNAVPMIFMASGSFLIVAIVVRLAAGLVLRRRKRKASARRRARVGEDRKDVILRNFSNGELVMLAKTISGSQVNIGMGRSELLRIIKEHCSIEEIRNRSKPGPGASE